MTSYLFRFLCFALIVLNCFSCTSDSFLSNADGDLEFVSSDDQAVSRSVILQEFNITRSDFFSDDYAYRLLGTDTLSYKAPQLHAVKQHFGNHPNDKAIISYLVNEYGVPSWGTTVQNHVFGDQYLITPVIDVSNAEVSSLLISRYRNDNDIDAKLFLRPSDQEGSLYPYFQIFDFLAAGANYPGSSVLQLFPPQRHCDLEDEEGEVIGCPGGCVCETSSGICFTSSSWDFYQQTGDYNALLRCGSEGGSAGDDNNGQETIDPKDEGYWGGNNNGVVWVPSGNRPSGAIRPPFFPWNDVTTSIDWSQWTPPSTSQDDDDWDFPDLPSSGGSGQNNDGSTDIPILDAEELFRIQAENFIQEHNLRITYQELTDIVDHTTCGGLTIPDFYDCMRFHLLDDTKESNPDIDFSNGDLWYVFSHFDLWGDFNEILTEENNNDYSQAAVEMYTKLARHELIGLSYAELVAQEALLDQIIDGSLTRHGMSDRLAISALTWYTMFNTEAADNGGSPLEFLRAQIRSIREGFLQVFQPIVDAHLATIQATAAQLGIPETAEEWRAVMAVFGPMLLELGVDIGTDFIPGVGEFKAFTKAGLAFGDGEYGEFLMEFIGGVAGILPIGDLIKGGAKVVSAAGVIFKSFKVIKAMARVSGSIFSKLIQYAEAGWKIAWDDGLKKLIFKSGDDAVGSLSKKTESISDPLDNSYPDGDFDVPSTKITKAEGWALKQGDDIAQSAGTVPTGSNQTYIGKKNIANNGHRIKVDQPQSIKNKVDDIVANGDQLGTKTEELSSEVLDQIYPSGTIYGPPTHNVHYQGNKGFDNIVVMPDGSVIINEAKQMSSTGSVTLGTGFNSPQMSDDWITGVIGEMVTSQNPDAAALAGILQTAVLDGKITRVVKAVDKTTSEIVITKLNPF